MLNPISKAEVNFEFKREIGLEGANSRTFLAHDHQLDAEIVIKQVPKASFDSVSAFFDEARILYLSVHANVVEICYACQDPDNIYIALPYYSNGSLNTLLNSRHLTVREIVVLGSQIASGLHNIHSKKLIHFDVKPDNVLLSNRGEALLSDFGLSKRMLPNGVAEQDRMYGKMRPPETYVTDQYGPAFDIYQFGVTLYRMCNGNRAFYSQYEKYRKGDGSFDRDLFKFDVQNGRFPDRSVFEERVPERMRKLVKKCLEVNPAERFRSIIDLANELAKVDDRLDWIYEEVGDVRTWTKKDDERTYTLTVDAEGKSVAEKHTKAQKSKIHDYCLEKITPAKIRKFLGET